MENFRRSFFGCLAKRAFALAFDFAFLGLTRPRTWRLTIVGRRPGRALAPGAPATFFAPALAEVFAGVLAGVFAEAFAGDFAFAAVLAGAAVFAVVFAAAAGFAVGFALFCRCRFLWSLWQRASPLFSRLPSKLLASMLLSLPS